MKRLAILLAALLTAVAVASAAAAPPSPSHARLRHFICQRALDPASRALATTAVMHSIPGTAKLALRFQLLTRRGSTGAWRSVTGGDLGTWISPGDPSLGTRPGDIWILNKQVVDLVAPASYRFKVAFRWIEARGRVLATLVRETPVCAQPELRPDLLVQAVKVSADPTSASRENYTATIRNRGATAAPAFRVLFTPGGSAPAKVHLLSGLAAHSSTQVSFRGPLCSSTAPPTITVDPNKQVDDYDRANNEVTVSCPAVAAQAQARRRG
jgi:hypothetical protein